MHSAADTTATLGLTYGVPVSHETLHMSEMCILDAPCHLLSEPGDLKFRNADTAGIGGAPGRPHAGNKLSKSLEVRRLALH